MLVALFCACLASAAVSTPVPLSGKAGGSCVGQHRILLKGCSAKHGFYVFKYVYSFSARRNQTRVKDEAPAARGDLAPRPTPPAEQQQQQQRQEEEEAPRTEGAAPEQDARPTDGTGGGGGGEGSGGSDFQDGAESGGSLPPRGPVTAPRQREGAREGAGGGAERAREAAAGAGAEGSGAATAATTAVPQGRTSPAGAGDGVDVLVGSASVRLGRPGPAAGRSAAARDAPAEGRAMAGDGCAGAAGRRAQSPCCGGGGRGAPGRRRRVQPSRRPDQRRGLRRSLHDPGQAARHPPGAPHVHRRHRPGADSGRSSEPGSRSDSRREEEEEDEEEEASRRRGGRRRP